MIVHRLLRALLVFVLLWSALPLAVPAAALQISLSPAMVAPAAIPAVTQVGAGGSHSCALRDNGSVFCWGRNINGQLGASGLSVSRRPIAVSGITNAVALSVGYQQNCVILNNRTIRCWGANNWGQLGNGLTADSPVPVQVSGITTAIAVSSGNGHTCALLTGGTVRCWGSNGWGQLGIGTSDNNPHPTPAPVSGITTAVSISAGVDHTCAVLDDGTIRCWGSNGVGQLGTGASDNNPHPTPVSVSGITTAETVSAGQQHTCAMLADDTARCWGSNGSGQLGNGSFAGSPLPVVVGNTTPLTTIASVVAGGYHTCAVLADGTARCWGENYAGQLGDGSTTTRSLPVTVSGLSGVAMIDGGGAHTCAATTAGNAFCWGENGQGQLADNTYTARYTPTLVVFPVFSISGGSALESSGMLPFTISLNIAIPVQTTVAYTASNGSAVAPADYQPTAGTLTFPANETQLVVNVPINADTIHELDETVSMLLSNGTGADIATDSASGTIRNDDPAPVLNVADVSVGEGGTASIAVTLTSSSSLTATVAYTTSNGTASAGQDYSAASGTLTFAPGQTSRTITVTTLNDATFEGNETFTIQLSAPANATIGDATGVVTIIDDDPMPALSIADRSVNEGDGGTVSAVFTVTLSAASGQSATVVYATSNGTAGAGQDYSAASGTLTFAPGQTSRTVTVAVLGDLLDEADETFAVTLSAPSNATLSDASGVGTIVDNDGAPALSIADRSVSEGDGGTVSAVFTVTLSAASGQTVSVAYATSDGTAGAGQDYSAASGTLTFAPGQTSRTVTVAVLGDLLDEADETFTVTLSAPSNATIGDSVGVGTIVDNDGAPTLSIADRSVSEGDGGTVSAVFTVTLSAASGQTVSVAYATSDGTASAGQDYSAASGTLSFAPGQTSRTVTVAVLGDLLDEADETFAVTLSAPNNATLSDSAATGTIRDDDPSHLYMPLLPQLRSVLIATINSAAIPIQPVVVPGAAFYTTTITLPAVLPSGGTFYLSGSPDSLTPGLVDDGLIMRAGATEIFRHDYGANNRPAPALIPVPANVLLPWVGQALTVTFVDFHGSVTQASPLYLVWQP